MHSLYFHIPFCRHRCAYCDFNTYAGQENLTRDYVRALCREMEYVRTAAETALPVHTVFFGGGTPSLLTADDLRAVLRAVRENFQLSPGAEITLEANPGTLTLAYLRRLRALGVNRLSIGVQSAHPGDLHFLERQHDYFDVLNAVQWARQAGFRNLSLDLIFGLPSQTLPRWQHTLELALGLQPEHFSFYALTIEHGTPMQRWAARGLIPTPDPDRAADMYEHALRRMAAAGYEQYEISNWAKRGEDGELLACRHNLQYWRSLPYLGLGAGAHGFAGGWRTANVLAPAAYIKRCIRGASLPFPRTPATVNAQKLTRADEMAETMMMGLRLVGEGVSDKIFRARFGAGLTEVYGPEIQELLEFGLVEWAGRRLRLTERGKLLGNQVFMRFV